MVSLILPTYAALCVSEGKFSEAEPLIAKALEIREKVLGMGHIGIAYTLAQLVSVHDKLGWYGDDQEAMLKRALEIFSRSQGGQHAQELQNTIAQLRHMRSRRSQQVVKMCYYFHQY